MDVGHLPIFVGTAAVPPDEAAAYSGPAGDTAERGFVSALADALGEDGKVPEAARSRGGGATPILPIGHVPPPDSAWTLLAVVFGPSCADPDVVDAEPAPGETQPADAAGQTPAAPTPVAPTPVTPEEPRTAQAETAGSDAAQPGLAGALFAIPSASAPAGNETPAPREDDARPRGADRLPGFPDSDERSARRMRAATGQPVARPEPAGDEGDHGPVADAGRADDGKFTGRSLFGGAGQGDPLADNTDHGRLSARGPAPAPTPGPAVSSPPPAPRGQHTESLASRETLSLQARELAGLANRGAVTPAGPATTGGPIAGPPPQAGAAGSDRSGWPVDPHVAGLQADATVSVPPARVGLAQAPPAAGEAQTARPTVVLPELPPTDRWAEDLVQQVSIAARALPGVSPRSNPDTAPDGRDGSPGRPPFSRNYGDSAAASAGAFGRLSAGEFAAKVNTLAPGGPAVFDQAAAEPASDGQPLSHAIVQSLKVQWRQGGGEARLRLQPEHLGEVSVSLRVQASTVTVVLRSDSPAVRGWMESHQAELRRALEAQGLVLDRLVIDPDDDAGQSRQDTAAGDQPPQRRRRHPGPGRFEALL